MFERIETQREFNLKRNQEFIKSADDVNIYVYDRASDYYGNRTAKIRITFSNDKGTLEFAPRNRKQTGYGSHRADGAVFMIAGTFKGLRDKIENRALEKQEFTLNGVLFRLSVDSDVL